MSPTAQAWTDKLDALVAKVTGTQKVSDEDLRHWVAECVSVFTTLGVTTDVIRGFMNMFENVGVMEYHASKAWTENYTAWQAPAAQITRISGFFYPNIAFTTARSLVQKLDERERLVPQPIIDLLFIKPTYAHLATSLQAMESAYEGKDAENLLSSTHALVWSLVALHADPGLKAQPNFKKELEYLADPANDPVRADFGIDRELFFLLSQFRYIRNRGAQHKQAHLPPPSLAVSLAFAYEALMLLYGTMGAGTLILP